ncbi:hypothetical protein ABIE52_000321 [Rhodococcus sp. OAS809]|jgi:hypothetical protein|nr:hypothetical protein B0E55_05229 [Rhodococcus sp. 66b]
MAEYLQVFRNIQSGWDCSALHGIDPSTRVQVVRGCGERARSTVTEHPSQVVQNQTHTFANEVSSRYQLEFCEGAYHPVEIALDERG